MGEHGLKIAGVPLFHAQLLGEKPAGEDRFQAVPPQDSLAQLWHAGSDQHHGLSRLLAATEKCPGARLQRNVVGIGIPGLLHPLGHDGLRRVGQPVVVPGKLRCHREDGVAHRVAVFRGGAQSPAGEKALIHRDPNAVGVDECAVQVKEQHE